MSIEIPVIPSPSTFRPMREANALLIDKPALGRQFEKDGYLFFRDVLDLDAVRIIQGAFEEELLKQGMIEKGDRSYRFIEIDLSKVRSHGGALLPADALHLREAWWPFATHPAIHAFIKDLIDDEPYWLPMNEYKAVPPGKAGKTRFNFVHQDSFYNKGIQFMTFWVPASEIDPDVGGIACAEGMHHSTYHDPKDPPAYFIPSGSIPEDSWVRSDYKPGDVLIMHHRLPHSGLSNVSNRFRLSMNIRFARSKDITPIVGKLISITPDRIVIEGNDGRKGDYQLNDDTNFRNYGLGLIRRSAVGDLYKPGDDLIVAEEQNKATIVRRTSSGAYRTEMASR
jgi:hypothetical protein